MKFVNLVTHFIDKFHRSVKRAPCDLIMRHVKFPLLLQDKNQVGVRFFDESIAIQGMLVKSPHFEVTSTSTVVNSPH